MWVRVLAQDTSISQAVVSLHPRVSTQRRMQDNLGTDSRELVREKVHFQPSSGAFECAVTSLTLRYRRNVSPLRETDW